jgi:hypothetical protein
MTTVSWNQSGTIDGPGTLTTAAATSIPVTLTLGGGLVWRNTGTVSAAGRVGFGDLSGASAAILNQGVFDLTTDSAAIVDNGVTNAGGTFTLGSGTFANAGVFAKTGGSGTSLVYAAITNTGSIGATGGTLELADGGVLGGAMGGSGAGVVAFGAGVFSLGASQVGLSGNLALDGGEIALTSGQTLALSGQLAFGQAIVGGGAVDGPGTLTTAGAISVVADGSPQIMLGGGVTWINSGTVADAGDMSIGDLSGNRAAIVNAAGGAIDFTADTGAILDDGYLDASGYYWQGSSTLANAGMIAKTGGSGTSVVQSVLTNTGTISAVSGTLALDGGGVLGGSIGATGGGVVALGGGSWTQSPAAMAIGGSFALTAGGIALSAGQTLTLSGSDALGASAVLGPGTLVTSGVSSGAGLSVSGGLSWRNGGTLGVNGVVTFGDAASTLANLAGGAVIFAGDVGSLAGAGKLSNAGLISKTAGSGTNAISATLLANSGTISASSGILALDGGGVLGGQIGGSGGGVVALGGGRFSLAGNLALSGALALAGGTIGLTGGQTLSLTGAVQFDGGTVDGGGTLATGGVVAASALTLGGGAAWRNAGTATLTGSLTAGDGSGGGRLFSTRRAPAWCWRPMRRGFRRTRWRRSPMPAVWRKPAAAAPAASGFAWCPLAASRWRRGCWNSMPGLV